VHVLLTQALLERALADELPGESGAWVWHFVKSLLQFEANVQWLWWRGPSDPVWDDVNTPEIETRGDIVEASLADAVNDGVERWGGTPADWAWGTVRPFQLRHLFASGEGPLGRVLNSEWIQVEGGAETPFKQQYPRSDDAHLQPTVGPLVRIVVDLADPWAARFSMAGGQSGWPGSPFYGNLLADWAAGRSRPLSPDPAPDDVQVQLVPAR
jgi:penicillin amidase